MMRNTIWNNGELKEINSDMGFFVGRCSSGHTVFGEHARWIRSTEKHMVFETVSGAIVKTEIDTLNTIGKARKNGYWVSIGRRQFGTDTRVYESKTSYWNEKKLVMEYK